MFSEAMDQVLPPWTEVMAEMIDEVVNVSVWGRTYGFAGAPLPTSILTGGEEVLSSPVRLVGTVDKVPISWERKGAFLFRKDKAQATISGWQANGSLIVNTTSQVEFDGLMRVDMAIMPQRGASPKLDELWLEIPLKADRSTLFHYWPGSWGSAANSGAIPEEGLAMPFKPFVWLGWEEGGLSWFTESDKGWQPRDANRYIEIVPQGEETLLRLHILDSEPERLPLTLTFGFQATPVKPIPKDFHEWRICHGASYGIEKRPAEEGKTVLDRMAELGVKTLIFHENWTPIQNYWETTHKAELRQLVTECHKRGIKLLLYFGYELSTLAPEWGRLSDQVLVKNAQGGLAGGYHRQPEQRDYIVCYNNRWQDDLVEGIARAMDRYGFDGVYLDGTTEPWGCANELHGCGYRDSAGNLRPTYPIFAVRKLMSRLYALIHPRGGFVNAHQSTCCVTPTLAYCHSYWDGEQFGGGELAGDPLQKLPLAAFKAEFMGRNFGVPCEFLVYEKPPQWTFEHALAFTLLHDVRVRPGGYGKQLEMMSKIWKAMSDFGVSGAEWHPYWRNQQYVSAQPESVKVSLYLKGPGVLDSLPEMHRQVLTLHYLRGMNSAEIARFLSESPEAIRERLSEARSLFKEKSTRPEEQGSQMLLAISNLSAEQEVEGQITLNISIPGQAAACDAITGEGLALEENCLRLTLPPMKARLVRVE